MNKKKTGVLTPLESKVMALLDHHDKVTLSLVQRKLQVSFTKACELIGNLNEKKLIESNIDQIQVTRP